VPSLGASCVATSSGMNFTMLFLPLALPFILRLLFCLNHATLLDDMFVGVPNSFSSYGLSRHGISLVSKICFKFWSWCVDSNSSIFVTLKCDSIFSKALEVTLRNFLGKGDFVDTSYISSICYCCDELESYCFSFGCNLGIVGVFSCIILLLIAYVCCIFWLVNLLWTLRFGSFSLVISLPS
jgi:hypothetical protein